MSLAKIWATPARRPGTRSQKSASHRLWAWTPGPASLVVGRRRRQGEQAPLLEERRDRVREEHLGGDPVGVVLGQPPVRVPAPVGGGRLEVGVRVDVRRRPGVELVVPPARQVGPVVGDVPAGVGVGADDGVAAVRCELGRSSGPLDGGFDGRCGAWVRGHRAQVSPSSAEGGSSPLAMASARACSRAPAASRSWHDHEPPVLDPLDGEPAELVQVDGVGRAAGGGQRRLELGERRARGRRAGPHPGQLGRPVALGLPQAGLEQAARRIEDGGGQVGALGERTGGRAPRSSS